MSMSSRLKMARNSTVVYVFALLNLRVERREGGREGGREGEEWEKQL